MIPADPASLPKFDQSVSWLCWAYNEEALIEDYLLRASALLERTVEDYEIIVVDDGSTDGTPDIVARLQKEIPRLKLIRSSMNLNVGRASQTAIANASKDFLFWQPIDWCYDISHLRTFLELLKQYDVVAGVRREPVQGQGNFWGSIVGVFRLFGIKHITKRSDTIPKAFVSIINYLLIRLLFRVPLSDYQNIVFYPVPLIQSLQFESRSSFTNPEGLLKAYWRGASFVEIPISFIPRTKGKAKGTRLKSIKNAILDIFRLWWKWMVLGRIDRTHPGQITRLNGLQWKKVEARKQ